MGINLPKSHSVRWPCVCTPRSCTSGQAQALACTPTHSWCALRMGVHGRIMGIHIPAWCGCNGHAYTSMWAYLGASGWVMGVHTQHVDAQALPRTHNGRTVAVTCWRLGADGSLHVRAIFYENWGRFGGRDGRPCAYVCAHVHVRPSKPEGFHFCTKWKCKVIEYQWLLSFKPTFRQCDLNFCNP